MSAEQLMQGMQAAFRSQTGDTRSNTPASTTSTQLGNFSRCTSRFSSVTGEHVDTLINAISVYKDCLEITDENALKGLPMLLTGLPAEWWSGVKTTVAKFEDAMRDLSNAFGAKKPAHQLYRELFGKEQDEQTKTDIFECKACALLAQLPELRLAESVQLDMVYGLLHRGIRKPVRREDVRSFDDLLRLPRTAEESFR